jgi:hypothetical protein
LPEWKPPVFSKTGGKKTNPHTKIFKMKPLEPVNVHPRLYTVCRHFAPEGCLFAWDLYWRLEEEANLLFFLDLEEAMIVAWSEHRAHEINAEGHEIEI